MPAVLITGAARGLGRCLAAWYRRRGWHVFAPGRSELDVTDERSILAYASSIAGQPIDVLFNNAGIRLVEGADRLGGFALQPWVSTLTVNVVGPALVTQAVLPNLRKGQQRKVVFMSSRLGSFAAGGGRNSGGAEASYSAYRVSKTALNQVTRCLAAELAPEGFCCLAVSPGWLRTDMGGASASDAPDEVAHDIAGLVDRLDQGFNGSFVDRHGTILPW